MAYKYIDYEVKSEVSLADAKFLCDNGLISPEEFQAYMEQKARSIQAAISKDKAYASSHREYENNNGLPSNVLQ